MMRVAIVDDDKKDLASLREYLNKAKAEVGEIAVDAFTDGFTFLETFDGKYDAVFLDVEMPLLDGMEVARRIRRTGSACCIVFITNMPQYAVQGYEVEAIGYLVKPVRYFPFLQTLKRVCAHAETRREEEVNIVINTRQEVKVLRSSSITFVEVESHNLVFHTADGGEFRTRDSLKALEAQLEAVNFCRCNSCYLVNLRYVESISGNTVRVAGTELLVSRHKKKEFTEKYMRYTR